MRLLWRGDISLWRDARVLRASAQIVSVLIVVSIVVFVVNNVLNAANDRNIPLGFDFLGEEAGFPIAESVVEYHEANSFRYAFYVGILNTLKVALIGIVAATALGVVLGVARISTNWLVNKAASLYIEVFRNIPLLIQLFFWYFGVFLLLPKVEEAIRWPGPIYISNRGIFAVWASPTSSFGPWLLFLLAGLILAVLARFALLQMQTRTGKATYPNLIALALFLLVPALGWFLVGDTPMARETPVLGRFNFEGGLSLTPEFAALLFGLVIYTASFIAEIVRSGIQAVEKGQVEASRALGLTEFQTLKAVIIPQSLRIIIPPLISQYLNLTKNSSLALTIGYPDIFGVGRIIINQAGRAVPVFALIMAAYLAMSLTYAVIGNLYNRHVRFVGH